MTTGNTLEINSNALPKDLVITSQPDSADKNKFQIVVTNLKTDEAYAFQFQYVFADGSLSQWSPGYVLLTPTETVPSAPSVSIPATSIGNIPVTLNSYPANAKRVDIVVIGGVYGTGTTVDYFLQAGTKTISISEPGEYQVSLYTVTPTGVLGTPTNTFTITVSTAGEIVEDPTNPNGFSIVRVLGGIEVVWAGTYANGTFEGFEAIKIYVGNSATATAGTFVEAGVMTGNNVRNSIIIPVDGTYLRYDEPVYIHARAVNTDGDEGTLQENVANNPLGARSAISSDLANEIITNEKLVDDAITEAKIATAAITETKIADDAITTPKLVANAITSDKIVSEAIIADKIATDAITATKIKAGEIDVTKLAAGTISVNNLEAGTISTTSFIRAGSTTGGARIEISSAAIPSGPSAGFYIYDSEGAAVLSAPLAGGLSIVGGGSFTGNLSIGSGNNIFKAEPDAGSTIRGIWLGHANYDDANFRVSTTGILRARSGNIGGWQIDSTQLRSSTTASNWISLDTTTPRITLNKGAVDQFSGVGTIIIDPVEGIKGTSVTVQGQPRTSFLLTPAGNARFAGTIFADDGKIGSWTISETQISGGYSGPFTVGLKVASVPPGTGGESVGDITIWAGTEAPTFGNPNTYDSALTEQTGSSSPFYVTNTGFVKATKGRIGGWFLGTNNLYAGADTSRVVLSSQETAGAYAIWAGSSNASATTPFSVTNTGNLRATNAYIRGEVLAASGGFGTITTVDNELVVSQGWTINDPENGTIQSTGYSTGALKIRLEGTTGSIVGGNFYIGGNKTGDQLLSDGTVKLGNDSIRYTPSTNTFEINPQGRGFANFKIRLNVVSNEDGNFADTTVVQDENGYLATGRALQYGGPYYPTDSGPSSYFDPDTGSTYNYNYPGGAEDWKENVRNKSFVTGDLWFSTKA